ncbi:MAG: hypothetical protein AB1721_01090 [Patescibacteria group bacterium]
MVKTKHLFISFFVLAIFLFGEIFRLSFWWFSLLTLAALIELISFSQPIKVRILKLIIFLAGGLSIFLFSGFFAYFFISLLALAYFFVFEPIKTKAKEEWLVYSLSFLVFFELFYLASSLKFAFIFTWLLFLVFSYSVIWLSFPELKKILAGIFSFVLSQFFLIFYFLPFGYFTGAALTLLFLIFGLRFILGRLSSNQIVGFVFALLALLISSGIKPRV